MSCTKPATLPFPQGVSPSYATLVSQCHLFHAMAGPQCCVPTPSSEHSCTGKEESFGPFLSYVTAPSLPKAAVILVADVFGFDAPLLRKLADKIATAGYFVVVPDYFNKDPFVPASGDNPFATFGDWFNNHKPWDVVEGTKQVVEGLNNKGFSSVGAVGFCWGAKVVVQLAKGDWLKAAVLCHPSFVTVEDIQDVKTPIAILAGEMDQTTPPALVKQFAEILDSKTEVESFAHIYPGVAHGWTVRYDADDKKAVERAEEAHNKILEWFGKLLYGISNL